MRIAEIFLSIQGEARQLGMPTWFIRTSGCNYNCSFCDSKYAKNGTEMSIEEIIKAVKGKSKNVVITGGEPYLQPDLPKLVREL